VNPKRFARLAIGHKSNRKFFGTGCIINEQVILQDQEGVLAWVSERLAVAMRQAEDRDYVLDKFSLIDLELAA
jgi:hypothetical protein